MEAMTSAKAGSEPILSESYSQVSPHSITFLRRAVDSILLDDEQCPFLVDTQNRALVSPGSLPVLGIESLQPQPCPCPWDKFGQP